MGETGAAEILFPIGLINISGISSEIAGTGAEGRLALAGIGAVGDGIDGGTVGGILEGMGAGAG